MEISEPLGVEIFYGVFGPELVAFSRQDEFEAKHGCKLKLLYVQMGGSVYPRGHQEFDLKPTISVWEKLSRG